MPLYQSGSSLYRNMNLVQDGKIHVVMINSFSKWLNQFFGVETKYTDQIDDILSCMQSDGFEIVDVKFNSIMNQGLFGEMEGFHTLILYRHTGDNKQKRKPDRRAENVREKMCAQCNVLREFTVDNVCSVCGGPESAGWANIPAQLIHQYDGYKCSKCGAIQRPDATVCSRCASKFQKV